MKNLITTAICITMILSTIHAQDQKKGMIDIPIDLSNGVPLLEVEIAGQGPFTMLLDTGVTPSAMDITTAQRIGLEVSKEAAGEASGSGDLESVPVYRSEIRGLRIGGKDFGKVTSLAIDLRGIGKSLGKELHGILGDSFLQGRIIEIDYPRRRLRIYDELPAAPKGLYWETELKLREGDIMPIIELYVDGEPVNATLDTGSSNSLTLFPPGYRKLGLEDAAREGIKSTVTGARGSSSISIGRVESIELGPFTCTETTVFFAERGASDKTRDGNFGGRLLNEFILLLDYKGKLIRVSRP